MDKKNIKKTIKKVQLEQNKDVATHDELMEANDHLEGIEDKLSKPLKLEKGVSDSISGMASFLSEMKGEKGDRGSKFIGKFKNSKELPDIDNINVKKGDWAYVEDTGEIWYN